MTLLLTTELDVQRALILGLRLLPRTGLTDNVAGEGACQCS